MRITKDQVIAGYPAFTIRKLLDHCADMDYQIEDIVLDLGCSESEALVTAQELVSLGYLKKIPKRNKWTTTSLGNTMALAKATFIKRDTAERIVKELVQRAVEINANNKLAFKIAELTIFGSYLSDSPTLGDIDIIYELCPRFEGEAQKEVHDARIDLARKNGRRFSSFMNKYLWPQNEVASMLKNNSKSISLHESLDKDLPGFKGEVIFTDVVSVERLKARKKK